MKQFPHYFKTVLFSLSLLITGNLSAQTNFVAIPATFVFANKPAVAPYSMSGILDGHGATGLATSPGGTNDFYWNKFNNPETFFININTASTINNMLFYKCWGVGEGVKNVTARWFTNNAHTGTAVADATMAPAGTYYAFYYDATNGCYSPASNAIAITKTVVLL